jgi:hypothetical protein
LTRIESEAFSSSSLESIEIPRNVEILGSSCFSCCPSLSSTSFESNSRLNRIESDAFSFASVRSIEIPRNVEILGSSCFYRCESLSSISFESNSRLNRIESNAFSFSSLKSIEIPRNVQFIACDAFHDSCQISVAHIDSCPEYARWQRLQSLGIRVDFRRIRRFDSNLPSRSDCLFNLFGFRERSQLSVNERFLTQKYQECDTGFEIVVKSMNGSVCDDIAHLESKIENLLNLRHPCISSTIGVVLPWSLQELHIVREYSSGCLLSEVLLRSPEWWTPTAKGKAIVGIVLSMRFAHSFGLLHGDLTEDSIFLNDEGLIQICDFCQNSLSEVVGNSEAMAEVGGFSGESWRPAADVRAFAELLSRIAIGKSAGAMACSQSVPVFVLKLIKRGQSLDSKSTLSFVDIFKTLKHHDFRILEGVDSKEVSSFVSWIESSEALTEPLCSFSKSQMLASKTETDQQTAKNARIGHHAIRSDEAAVRHAVPSAVQRVQPAAVERAPGQSPKICIPVIRAAPIRRAFTRPGRPQGSLSDG